MSDIVRRGDFLVYTDHNGRVIEFFIALNTINLSNYEENQNGRRLVPGCFGFRLSDCSHYRRGSNYWINRKATLEERDRFLLWMEWKGHKLNLNTLELTLNR